MYTYEAERPYLFTEEGQRLFLKVRDETHRLLKLAGAVRLQEAALSNAGSSWSMIACMDRLVELGEIKELKYPCAGQHRVFVSTRE